MITLYHWDLPQALQDEGGWEARTTAEAFAEYARLCYARFGSRVKLWATFNETIVFIGHGYINGLHPPAVRDPARAIQACHHVFIAHALAVKAFREMAWPARLASSTYCSRIPRSPTARRTLRPPNWLTPSIPTGCTIRC
jgi:beta-glucosidase/6-phospho-beta-glucosidase/beta-galactosidase